MASKNHFVQPSKQIVGSSSVNAKPSTVGAGSSEAGFSKRPGAIQNSGAAKPTSSSIPRIILGGVDVTPRPLIPNRSVANKDGSGNKRSNPAAVQTILESDNNSDSGGKLGLSVRTLKRGESFTLSGEAKSPKPLPTRSAGSGLNFFRDGSAGATRSEEMCVVSLSETNTQYVLHIPSLIAANDMREVSITVDRNKRYDDVVLMHKTSSDSFTSHHVQTLRNPSKDQNEMAAPNAQRDMGAQITSYDITDENAEEANKDALADAVGEQGSQTSGRAAFLIAPNHAVQKFVDDTVNVCLVSAGCVLDMDFVGKPQEAKRSDYRGSGGPSGAKGKRFGRRSGQAGGASVSGMLTSGNSSGGESAAAHGGSDKKRGQKQPRASGTSNTGNESDGSTGDVFNVGYSSGGAGHNQPQQQQQGDVEPETSGADILIEKQVARIMAHPQLLKRLQMIERAVLQNVYHRHQLDYRDFPDVPPLSIVSASKVTVTETSDTLLGSFGASRLKATTRSSSEEAAAVAADQEGLPDADPAGSIASAAASAAVPKIRKLFNLHDEDLIKGRSVNAMAWNAINFDLLAVAYGKVDTFLPEREVTLGGLVLFWSLRNPVYPERVLRVITPVTALDFSPINPSVLAVGTLYGEIFIYDLKRDDWSKPIESSFGMTTGHTGAVWQVKWVVRGQEKSETMVSISADGTVFEWNLKKGLVATTLMQLRRGGAGEGWLSRQAAGYCFDFSPDDGTSYLVGTEDGALHKCSVSYSEQYLETYEPHTSPLYRVKFSRSVGDLACTCSADGSLGLYSTRAPKPISRLRCSGEEHAINDVCWCPGNSTVIAAVTSGAKIQIWDIAVSNLDPIISHDTNPDSSTIVDDADEVPEETEKDSWLPPGTAESKVTASGRHERKGTAEGRDAETAVTKLLKNLLQGNSRPNNRRLTAVLFGSRTPILVVGDNRGELIVYRVMDPVTVTSDGPRQQAAKLSNAVGILASNSTADALPPPPPSLEAQQQVAAH